MTLQTLNAGQLAGIEALVLASSIESVAADHERAAAFVRKARIKCADVNNAQHHENRFDLGYGACHDIGEALLSAYGYRTRSGSGQHVTVGRFMALVLDQPPGSLAVKRYDPPETRRTTERSRSHRPMQTSPLSRRYNSSSRPRVEASNDRRPGHAPPAEQGGSRLSDISRPAVC